MSCFRKYHSKVLKRFSFFEIEESLKIAILVALCRRKWPKIAHFLFARTDKRDDIYRNILWVAHSACLAVSKALI